jgi:WD40 repeat protein
MNLEAYTMRIIKIGFLIVLGLILVACGISPSTGGSPTAAPARATAQPTAVQTRPTTAPAQPTVAPAQPTVVPDQPTVAPDQPTSVPTGAVYPFEPEDVVRAFLTEFAAGQNRTLDPALYLSSELRAQIRPDYPLNLILGVQNMYEKFTILDSEGAAGTVRVRAALEYSRPLEWTFALIQEDGQWHIAQIMGPDGSTSPAPTATPNTQPAAGGTIYYLDADGSTIKRINPNGGDPQTVYPQLGATSPIDYLGAGPDDVTLLVGAERHYFTVSGGVRKDLGDFVFAPRWSPDGTRLAGQSLAADGGRGPIAIYDLLSRESITLPVAGVPDWYPDGQSLVYAGAEPGSTGSNVYRYDLASGTSARLTDLPSTEGDVWYVQEAHVLPGGQAIVFYGNHTSQVGASGNGQQWWWVPVEGGQEQLFSTTYSNGVRQYLPAPGGNMIAYSAQAHVSACASAGEIAVRDTAVPGDSEHALRPPLQELSGQGQVYALIQGISWSPEDEQLVFGITSYTCQDTGREQRPSAVYLWDLSGAARKIVDGSYPVWVR